MPPIVAVDSRVIGASRLLAKLRPAMTRRPSGQTCDHCARANGKRLAAAAAPGVPLLFACALGAPGPDIRRRRGQLSPCEADGAAKSSSSAGARNSICRYGSSSARTAGGNPGTRGHLVCVDRRRHFVVTAAVGHVCAASLPLCVLIRRKGESACLYSLPLPLFS
uniref:Uncharacterized protein n=1 Tax=Plectus sambesii TaxID=2011161 RepID=A0A914V459_9BILA